MTVVSYFYFSILLCGARKTFFGELKKGFILKKKIQLILIK